MPKIDLPTRICQRCGHGSDPEKPWILRKSKEPVVCPKCKSPYWRTKAKPRSSKESFTCKVCGEPKAGVAQCSPEKEICMNCYVKGKKAEGSRKNEE